MKKYSKHAISQKSNKKHTTEWAFQEGVFETPQGFFIARIKINNTRYNTISKHETHEEATEAYNNAKSK